MIGLDLWPMGAECQAYCELDDQFSVAEIADMHAAIMSSPHLSSNQLGPRFARSRRIGDGVRFSTWRRCR
ncbi:MAG: hypothetical protein MJE77_26830 [Proteobacteria bacterium]|nr:hypothetical protein [Pseudomonadota bacterium]